MGEKKSGEEARQELRRQSGWLKLTEEKLDDLVERVEEIKWEHSSFSDPGADWNKLHLTLKDGSKKVLRQEGY